MGLSRSPHVSGMSQDGYDAKETRISPKQTRQDILLPSPKEEEELV